MFFGQLVWFPTRAFNVMCLQHIYNYFSLTNFIQVGGRIFFMITVPEKHSSTRHVLKQTDAWGINYLI